MINLKAPLFQKRRPVRPDQRAPSQGARRVGPLSTGKSFKIPRQRGQFGHAAATSLLDRLRAFKISKKKIDQIAHFLVLKPYQWRKLTKTFDPPLN